MSQEQYVDVAYNYIFDITLTPAQALLNQQVPILTTADFIWRGLKWNLVEGSGVSSFSVRFYDGQQYALSTDLIPSQSISNDINGNPVPMFPEVWYPAGGKILIDITETAGLTASFQLLFIGANRYRAEM